MTYVYIFLDLKQGLFKTTGETINHILKTQGASGFYVGYMTVFICMSTYVICLYIYIHIHLCICIYLYIHTIAWNTYTFMYMYILVYTYS